MTFLPIMASTQTSIVHKLNKAECEEIIFRIFFIPVVFCFVCMQGTKKYGKMKLA